MTSAQRIIYWQSGIALASAALIPLVMVLFSEQWIAQWAACFASMLAGGLSVVLPSWAYVAATKGEHRGERLLLLAWVKILGTMALLALGMVLVPKPQWLLGGLALAYLSHALVAYWQPER